MIDISHKIIQTQVYNERIEVVPCFLSSYLGVKKNFNVHQSLSGELVFTLAYPGVRDFVQKLVKASFYFNPGLNSTQLCSCALFAVFTFVLS